MPVLIIFMFVVVFVVVVALGKAHSQKVNETWSVVAQDLHLSHDPGGAFRGRTLSGRLRDNDVLVDTFTRSSGKSSTTYTRYRIRYPHALGLGLKLAREGFLSGVSKAFGAQDIQVGDATFDQGVMVKGDDPAAVRHFLTLARRARVHRALMSFNGLKIGDQEIYLERTGLEGNGARLTDTVRRLALLAWFLSGDRAEDEPLERATRARMEGRLDDAIQAVREVPAVDKVIPVEARLMEAHMLHLGDRDEEAVRVLNEVTEATPDDVEVQAWNKLRESAPPPPPPLPPEEAEVAEEPAAPAGTPPTIDGPAVADFCSAVFTQGGTSADTAATFASDYAGKRVRWSGNLRTFQSTSFDFVFGDKPCTKATLEVHELDGGLMGGKTVKAIVQFPPEAKDTFQDQAGAEIAFSGELLKVDGLMRNIYVKSGSLE